MADLGATYDDDLKAHWKARSGHPISVNCTFSLGRTAEALRTIICSKSAISLQRRPVDPKFQVQGVAPTNHSFSLKTGLNDLSYGVKIWTDCSSVLSQCMRFTDRLTDRILMAKPRLHSMQRGKIDRTNERCICVVVELGICITNWCDVSNSLWLSCGRSRSKQKMNHRCLVLTVYIPTHGSVR